MGQTKENKRRIESEKLYLGISWNNSFQQRKMGSGNREVYNTLLFNKSHCLFFCRLGEKSQVRKLTLTNTENKPMSEKLFRISVHLSKLHHRHGRGITSLPLTQPARIRFPVRPVFLVEAFSGGFPQLKDKCRENLGPIHLRISLAIIIIKII